MISRWLIFFSSLCLLNSLPLCGTTVTGKVALRDSRDRAVVKGADFSGVVVSLRPTQNGAPASPGAHRAKILQKDKAFAPHLLAVQVGSIVDFPNLDPIFHNAFSSYNGQIFDIGLYPPGSTRSVRFTREGVVRVFCNIHSAMSAIIVVLATSYFTISKSDGSFEIPFVPPGDYDLSVFHERATDAALRALGRKITVGNAAAVVPPLAISEAGYLPVPHTNKFGHDYQPDSDPQSLYSRTRK